jgi:hypothetical protein
MNSSNLLSVSIALSFSSIAEAIHSPILLANLMALNGMVATFVAPMNAKSHQMSWSPASLNCNDDGIHAASMTLRVADAAEEMIPPATSPAGVTTRTEGTIKPFHIPSP